MKKILITLLLFTSFLQAQTYPLNPTKFGKISLNTNGVSASTNKINTQEADGQINYIDAVNLPVPTTVTNALELKTENSAGAISGFGITNNGNGTVNIASGVALLRIANTPTATLIKYPIPAVTNLALTDNVNNYVLVDYNGGTPSITVTTSPGTINTATNSLIYVISRVGNTLDYVPLVGQNVDANAKLRRRFLNSEGLRRASGAVLTGSNRNLLVTAGLYYSGLIEVPTPAFNTSSGDTFTQVYESGSTWIRSTGNTQINNTQYNNAGVLTNMPTNDYRVDYVYILANNPSKLYVILGNTTYANITNARLAPVPANLPSELQAIGTRIGRVIIQRLATTMEVSSEFATVYNAGSATLHNDLGGLNAGDFQHLTANEKATVEYTTNKTGTLTASSTLYPNNNAVIAGLGISSPATVYVATNGNNSTAELGNRRKPYLTIDAALDALPASGGVVNIGVGTFSSPTTAKIKHNVSFIGSGKPYPNMVTTYVNATSKPTITSPTALIGGTILTNTFDFSFKNNIEIRNLGVDVGKAWIDANNGGNPKEGIFTGQLISHPDNNTSPPSYGLVLDNVSSLNYSSAAPVHSVLIENTIDAKISNISTYFGIHGLVIKSRGTNVNNVESYGHGGEGLIIKADTYAYSGDVNVNNIYISSIGANDGGGIMIDGGSGLLQRVNISNANIEFTKYGITTTSGLVKGLNISNSTIKNTNLNAVYIQESVKDVNLSNIIQDGTVAGNGFELRSTGTDSKSMVNCKSSNSSYNGFYLYTNDGGLISVNNLVAEGNDTGATIVGNVYGSSFFSDNGITGTLLHASPNAADFIAQINSSGQTTKSSVKVSDLFPKSGGTVTGAFLGNAIAWTDAVNNTGYLGIRASGASIGADDNLYFETSATNRMTLSDTGILKINTLSGTGIRVVTADASGNLSTDSTTYAPLASPALTGTPTAPTPTTGTGIANKDYVDSAVSAGTSEPYLVYTALVSQSGTGDPTATVLRNTLGGTVAWTRTGAGGNYDATLSGAFTSNKTTALSSPTYTSGNYALTIPQYTSTSTIHFITINAGTDLGTDDLLDNTFIEIRVYP